MRSWFLVLFVVHLLAGSLPSTGQHLFTRKISSDEYKAGQNYDITQDDQGIIFLATSDGVLTYDGIEWDLVSLPGIPSVFSVAADSTNKIYVGRKKELGYISKDNTGKYSYYSLLPYLDEKFKNIGYVYKTTLFKESVFFCDGSRVYIYSNGKFNVQEVKTDTFKSIFVLGDHLFISSVDDILYEYVDGQLKPILNDKGIHVWDMSHYRKNTGLVLDSNNQLWLFNPDTLSELRWQPFKGNYKQQIADDRISHIKYIGKDRIILFTDKGILLMNENGDIYGQVGSTYLDNYTFENMLLDASHNIWVVCPVYILQISTSQPLYYLNSHDGFKGQIISLAKDGDDEYIGTGWGIYHRKNTSSFTPIFPDSERGEAWNLYKNRKRILAAHRDGVFELKDGNATKIINHPNVMSLCELKKHPDTFILGTYNTGIWLLSKQQGIWKKNKIKGFEEYTRYLLEDEGGNIWISEFHTGIWKLHLNAQMDSVVSQTLYNKENGLPSNVNNRIYKLNNGKIVVATVNGVYSYNGQNDLFEPEQKINEALGGEVSIYSMAEAQNGDIYFWGVISPGVETAGVLRMEEDGTCSLKTSLFGKISKTTREKRIDVEAPLLIAGQEEIWIGNRERLIVYNPKQEVFYDDPVQIHIKYAWAKDSLIFKHGQPSSAHTLSYRRNDLSFIYASTFFESEDKTLYQYKLEGFDDNWSAWSSLKQANFTNIPEGNYTFIVRAKNVHGHLGESDRFEFSIIPPWYRTAWAYLAYTLLGALFIYLLIFLKTKSVKRQKKLLEIRVNKKTMKLLLMNEEIIAQNEEISSIIEDVNKKNVEITRQAKDLERTNAQLKAQRQMMIKNMTKLQNTQKVIERQAKELKESNLTKDKIFSIISHDLRGTVNQLPELLNLMESGHLTLDEFKLLLPELKQNATNLSTLTDNILHWAKSQIHGIEIVKTWFNLNEIVKENVLLSMRQAQKKSIQLTNNVNVDQLVFADKDTIRLLLRNLISNGIKFTPNNGKVTISTQIHESSIYVSVADTGIGLSKKEVDSIFGQGYYTKRGTGGEKGSGLGLKLCREFAEKNGGTLTIESAVGQGSKITFCIPLDEANSQ